MAEKKVTIKSLKEKLDELNRRSKNITSEFPEIVEAVLAFDEARQHMYEVHRKYDKQIAARQKELMKEQFDINQQIKEIRKKREIDVPEEIYKWLHGDFAVGIDFGYGGASKNLKIVWLSDDKKFAIVTNKGGEYWSGIGFQNYGRASHWGVEVFGDSYAKISPNFITSQIEGRLTKVLKQQLIDEINEYRKQYGK